MQTIIKGATMLPAFAMVAMAAMLTGCDDTESYSDLLRDEEKAVNWYLAQHRVEPDFPEDGNFEYGEDAPFYRMDADGHLYMQVITPGNPESRPSAGDKVLFRFSRQNLKLLYEGTSSAPSGNMDNLNTALGSTYFFYGNTTYPSSAQYGTGIQVPMEYFGYNSEVNLVMKSYAGFVEDQTQCVPYVVNVKYYKPEY